MQWPPEFSLLSEEEEEEEEEQKNEEERMGWNKKMTPDKNQKQMENKWLNLGTHSLIKQKNSEVPFTWRVSCISLHSPDAVLISLAKG